jgi:hypothetical protein
VTGRLYWSTADTRPYTYVGCGKTDYWVVQSIDPSGLLSWNPGVATVAPKSTTTSTTISPVTVPTTTLNTPTTTPPLPLTSTIVGMSQISYIHIAMSTLLRYPDPTPTPNPSPSTTNNGAIIGGAVGGGAVAIGLIVLGVLLFLRRTRNPTPATPGAQQQFFSNQQPPPDMKPMSYIAPGSPPPFSAAYNQNPGVYPTGKPGDVTYQYAPVPNKDVPVEQAQPYPQAAEVSGIPVGHAMELPGSPTQRPPH